MVASLDGRYRLSRERGPEDGFAVSLHLARPTRGARRERGRLMSGIRSESSEQQASAAAAISNLVVRLMNEYTGRGATKAWTSIDNDLVTCVLRDILTKGERSLVEDGKADLVMDMRRAFQETMREDLVAGVELIMERKVIAFMSANHIDPDMAAETFVLAPNSNSLSEITAPG